MTHWTIYERPHDAPDGYVPRATFIMEGGGTIVDPMAWYADEPEKLRGIIPPGLTCITRGREDDPAVKETWL